MKVVNCMVILLMLVAGGGLFFVWRDPVSSTFHRLIWIFGLAAIWGGGLVLGWRIRALRFALVTILLLSGMFLVLPSREIDREELRSDYVRRMAELEGVDYYWGGESRHGIDCSGLPRRAYRDALLAYGLSHLDGGAVRGFLEQWWFDTSARALGEGYRDFTVPLEAGGSVAEMDYSKLKPGDLAVTVGGMHVLVYAGDNHWIQADPGIDRVATLHGRHDKNNWFKRQVTLHRWRTLDEG